MKLLDAIQRRSVMEIKFKNTGGGIIILSFFIVVFLVASVGWVKNIIKFADCDFEAPYRCETVHALGLFPPVGMITGWLDLGS
jgi:hypothetical protein